MKFLLDEMVWPAVSAGMRTHGIDATSVRDLGLLGASDDDLFDFACNNRLTIVTADRRGFVHHAATVAHSGIVLFTRTSMPSVGALVMSLTDLVERHPEGLNGQILWLGKGGGGS